MKIESVQNPVLPRTQNKSTKFLLALNKFVSLDLE